MFGVRVCGRKDRAGKRNEIFSPALAITSLSVVATAAKSRHSFNLKTHTHKAQNTDTARPPNTNRRAHTCTHTPTKKKQPPEKTFFSPLLHSTAIAPAAAASASLTLQDQGLTHHPERTNRPPTCPTRPTATTTTTK